MVYETKFRHTLAILAGLCAIAIALYAVIDGVYGDLLLITWGLFCAGVGVVAVSGDYVRFK